MLSAIAPFGLDDLARGLVRELPRPFVVVGFVLLLSLYVYVAVRIANLFLSRLDYSVATALRKIRLRPSSLQIFIGDVLERIPGWVVRIGLLLTAVALVHAYLVNVPSAPRLSGFWQQLFEYWTQFIGWLWS